MALILSSTPVALWHDIIAEAEHACEAHLEARLKEYVVLMLLRYLNQPELVRITLAERYLDSMNLSRKNQALAYQHIGDVCLLFAGLFPGIARRKLVKITYFIEMGQGAYSTVSRAQSDVYAALAEQFVLLMDVLQSTRVYSYDYPDLYPLEAYELWQEVGSKRALNVLKKHSQFTRTNPICPK